MDNTIYLDIYMEYNQSAEISLIIAYFLWGVHINSLSNYVYFTGSFQRSKYEI